MTRTSADLLETIRTRSDPFSVSQDGVLTMEGVRADDLVARFGSPLFVISDKTLRANYRRIRDAFEVAWPREVNILYAIKCNPNFAVRAVLHEEGAGGDCFGIGELEATFAGGADPAKIALNGSSKSDQVLRRAVELGVTINMDGEEEIDRIAAIAEQTGKRVRVNIRLKIIPPSYSEYESDLISFRGDFRAELQRMKWGVGPDLAARMVGAAQLRPSLHLAGYHTHLGRLAQRVDRRSAYDAEFGRVVAQIYRETGFAPEIIDIGGGWPRERDPESKSQSPNPFPIEAYARETADALLDAFEAAAMPVPALWVEPGRFIAGNAGVLLTSVTVVKEDEGLTWANVDASTNLVPLIGTGAEGTVNHVVAATRMHEAADRPADVVGPICIPSVLAADCALPNVRRGDLVAILDAGMYAESDSHQLNWMTRPATVMVRGGDAAVIRAAETLAYMFANQRIPEWLASPGISETPYRAGALGARYPKQEVG